ncbi:hypothetical protein H0H87_005273 [Tephrocybe sp. NHM501043]|nr:hypothetical protein H0H87_005273 [Tephrocybe sp. NHM501043]
MNHNVDDPEKGYGRDMYGKDYGKSLSSKHRPQNILTRIRNLNMSSIGSAFSGPLSAVSAYVTQESAKNNYNYDTWNYTNDIEAGRTYENSGSHHDSYYYTHAVESSTPTQTRSNSPLQTQSGRLSEVKRIFNNLARFRHAGSDQMPSSTTTDNDWTPAPRTQQNHPPLYAPSVYEWDEASGTPPLTPDSYEFVDISVPGDYDHDEIEWTRIDSEIREGKKPDRSFEDIPLHDLPTTEISRNRVPAAEYDDKDEWYGLEYTLEVSCRERLPSDTKSAGEHSKSRESWAAIHQGTMHPFFEDEDYYQWKNWHRYLDRQDERKKHQRGFEFKARSKNLAWVYVDEIHTRDLLYWQKAGFILPLSDAKT